MYIAHALTISALMHTVNLENMEMSAWSILSGVIETYNPNFKYDCRNPTLAKCGGEAQHLEKVRSWSSPGLSNV